MSLKGSKRAWETIDLTAEDDNWDPYDRRKQQRVAPSPSTPSALVRSDSQAVRASWTDANEEVDLTQDFDDNELQSFRLYGTWDNKVVGVRYYQGRATPGEIVLLHREPRNPYDFNAVRVVNVMGDQIGHLPKAVAAKLAPFMDSRSLLVECVLTGPKAFYDAPISLKLFGTSDPVASAALKNELMSARLPVNALQADERERKKREQQASKDAAKQKLKALRDAARLGGSAARNGKGTSSFDAAQNRSDFANLTVPSEDDADENAPSMDQIMESAVQFNPREIGQVVDKYGAGEDALAQLPFADQPPSLATRLLPYQRQGLAWMIDHENPVLPAAGSNDVNQLWRANRDKTYTNIATNYTMSKPKLASGGILADDMGLGKTIQVLSLIVADPHPRKQPTLIVSPLSVMSNWAQQAQVHVKSGKPLKVFTYHGNSRQAQTSHDFEQYDIVVVTYQTLALEYLPAGVKSNPQPVPRKTGLFSTNWRRVVLDEGHNIRSPKAKMSQAAYALLAGSRWVLTGTPIVNNLRDFYSHVKFLRLTGGLEQQDIFSSALIRPLNQGRPEASLLLQAIMSTLCLRRTKTMKFIDLKLPKLTSHRYSVAFYPHEREKYDAFMQEAKGLLTQYKTRNGPKGNNTYSHLLEVLLRMRQTCNHWKLCGERATNLLALLEQHKKVSLTPQNLASLQDLLQLSIDSQEDCPICLETLHAPAITACAHVFGSECIERVIETQHKCPMCRAALAGPDELVHPRAEPAAPPAIDPDTSSSKLEALVGILKATRRKSPDVKTVVFSQWTSFLDVVEPRLRAAGITFARLDGSMSAARRDDATHALAHDPATTVLLASLAVCSVGLNLVAASQVVLADSWWAPAIEDQAVDRVHRLGQTRDTAVFRLVMEDSIEERVLDVQTKKRALMMQAFGEKTMRRGERSARLADIEKLLA